MSSPTSRSLEQLKKDGYFAQVVERWNPYAKIRQDLFGVIDIVAIKATEMGVLAIQATSGSNTYARVVKCLESPFLAAWLGSGNRLEVWGWAKRGARGERKLWTLKKTPIVLPGSAVPNAGETLKKF